jgi:hypothetical protein
MSRSDRVIECRARRLIPVPLSPSSNVVAVVGATFSITRTFIIDSLIAITPANGMGQSRVNAQFWLKVVDLEGAGRSAAGSRCQGFW